MEDIAFAIKADDRSYYTGLGWDKQIRKAKLYHSFKYAKDIRDAKGYQDLSPKIVRVRIIWEESDYNPDWEDNNGRS